MFNKYHLRIIRSSILLMLSIGLLGCALSPYERCALVYANREENSPSQSDAKTAAAMIAAAYVWGTFMPECQRGQKERPDNIDPT